MDCVTKTNYSKYGDPLTANSQRGEGRGALGSVVVKTLVTPAVKRSEFRSRLGTLSV